MRRMDAETRSTDATSALGAAYCPLHRDALLAAHKAGEDTTGVSVKLALSVEEIEVKGDTFSFISTTGAIDRDLDIIRPRGLDVSAWNQNSIILFSHDVRQRIGVGDTRLTSRGDKWITTAEYFPAEISPLAVSLRRMIDFRIDRAKRLKTKDKGGAFSIGFIPQKLSFVPERNGFDIEKAEKLEDSDVSLQSNRDALIARDAFSDGAIGTGLFDWAEHVRREIGIDGARHDVGQMLIELVDAPKGFTLIQITPEHLKHLKFDPPAEPRPAPIEVALEQTDDDPAEVAIRCRREGLGDELIQHVLCLKFPEALAEIETEVPEPETTDLPAAADPSDAELVASVERALAGDGIQNLLIQEQAATGHLN